jgi:beta-lactam-binding protein with PASTA domain
MKITSRPWFKISLHLSIAIALGILITLIFFNIYLPSKTNHGETITVPNVVGIHYDDLEEYLIKRNLRFEITEDSSYSADYQPLEVLRQVPLPNSKVKEGRKIYLTLNTNTPPKVRMPDLINTSIKNAQIVMKSFDLRLGSVEYIPDEIFGTVLKQKIDGKEIKANEMVPKGSVIDIVSGNGFGVKTLLSPNLIELDSEDAQIAIVGSGLQVGKVRYDNEGLYVITETNEDGEEESVSKQVAPGAVFRQWPEPGIEMRLKQSVDIWIYRPDSINSRPSLLDE